MSRVLREVLVYVISGAGVCWIAIQLTPAVSQRYPSISQSAPDLIAERLPAESEMRRIDLPETTREFVDPNFRPASGYAIPAFVGQAVIGATPDIAIDHVKDKDGFKWSLAIGQSELYLPDGNLLQLHLSHVAPNTAVLVSIDNRAAQSVTVSADGYVAIAGALSPGRRDISVTVPPQTTPSAQIAVVVPGNQPPRPTFTNIFNNEVANVPVATSPRTPATAVKVYDGYFRCTIQGIPTGTLLSFVLFDKDLNELPGLQPRRVTTKRELADSRTIELLLPVLTLGQTYALFARADLGRHSFSDPIYVLATQSATSISTPKDIAVFAEPPAKDATNQDRPTINVNGLWLSNTMDVTLRGKATFVPDAQVALFTSGSQIPLNSVALPESGNWTVPIRLQSPDNSIYAAVVQGNQVGSGSETVRIKFSISGPTVVGVRPTNLAEVQGRGELTVQFNSTAANPLQSGTASRSANYRLTRADGTTLPGTEGTPTSAVFDAPSNTVALTFGTLQPGLYKLRIFGTTAPANQQLVAVDAPIQDLFGNRLGRTPDALDGANFDFDIVNPVGADSPSQTRGVRNTTGPNTEFPVFTNPRPDTNGFNPSDFVVSRVVRLYYFRDAHRVAQIVNREVRSYNRAAVDVAQQLADKARQEADAATDTRRLMEFRAVEAAKATRQVERDLQGAQRNASVANQQAVQARTQVNFRTTALEQAKAAGASLVAPVPPPVGASPAEQMEYDTALANFNKAKAENLALVNAQTQQLALAQTSADQAETAAQSAAQQVRVVADTLNSFREEETQATERSMQSQAKEDRTREEQFRREVAAAHEDPDTYVAGKIESIDPVRQVSISVIGEGVIQLRGPIKGVNIIRTMINQIDAPVGQVRITVHTAQVNGEHGDRMEFVTDKIHKYIDHSRFLTTQSAEMLRKAIAQVAAQKATECGDLPGVSQEVRDQKYLYSFFGRDFIRELEQMDSEFLHTGNKLLSLNSMDTTSLASALFVMALAKNSVRLEILQEFHNQCQVELPVDEMQYFEAGFSVPPHKCEQFCQKENFQLLARNAKFQSISGFFDGLIIGDDTISPVQREFIRLAQIFKNQLVIEREYKQRVMERAVIEERLGNRFQELSDAKRRQTNALTQLHAAREELRASRRSVLLASQGVATVVRTVRDSADTAFTAAEYSKRFFQDVIAKAHEQLQSGVASGKYNDNPDALSKLDRIATARTIDSAAIKEANESLLKIVPPQESVLFTFTRNEKEFQFKVTHTAEGLQFDPVDEATTQLLAHEFEITNHKIQSIVSALQPYADPKSKEFRDIEMLIGKMEASGKLLIERFQAALAIFNKLQMIAERISDNASNIENKINAVVAELSVDSALDPSATASNATIGRLLTRLLAVADEFQRLPLPLEKRKEVAEKFTSVRQAFENASKAQLEHLAAQQIAEESRTPLDHKKFLDMLIDEIEDKYIELMEGTRAHTANVDAYIKRLATALDDDFNTQFYSPAFRQVRSASRMWDVTMGQVETTSILANNRSFAKVEPQATMEFDLPKRDIVIAEAMQGAKAAVDTFGGLVNDPSFLALTKLNSGSPTSVPGKVIGQDLGTVRDVLPGLPGTSSEDVISQAPPGNPELGAPLEALIPDPAVYKFETGTGFEIRPVIQPDGQAVVFHFKYMYTTNVREPVRADEKHLGRVKRHFIDTDVQLGDYELREVSKYTVALKASRTSRGVPLLEDIPIAGILFRPLPSAESSLQENIIMAHATIFPTLFDLMGMRWAPAVADLDPLRTENQEFLVKGRYRVLNNRVFDHSAGKVDEFLRIPPAERRPDLYRSQETIPHQHPNGYRGPGLNLQDSIMQEGYAPPQPPVPSYIPSENPEGSDFLPYRQREQQQQMWIEESEIIESKKQDQRDPRTQSRMARRPEQSDFNMERSAPTLPPPQRPLPNQTRLAQPPAKAPAIETKRPPQYQPRSYAPTKMSLR